MVSQSMEGRVHSLTQCESVLSLALWMSSQCSPDKVLLTGSQTNETWKCLLVGGDSLFRPDDFP